MEEEEGGGEEGGKIIEKGGGGKQGRTLFQGQRARLTLIMPARSCDFYETRAAVASAPGHWHCGLAHHWRALAWLVPLLAVRRNLNRVRELHAVRVHEGRECRYTDTVHARGTLTYPTGLLLFRNTLKSEPAHGLICGTRRRGPWHSVVWRRRPRAENTGTTDKSARSRSTVLLPARS